MADMDEAGLFCPQGPGRVQGLVKGKMGFMGPSPEAPDKKDRRAVDKVQGFLGDAAQVGKVDRRAAGSSRRGYFPAQDVQDPVFDRYGGKGKAPYSDRGPGGRQGDPGFSSPLLGLFKYIGEPFP